MKRSKWLLAGAVGLSLSGAIAAFGQGDSSSVENTKHNLTASGPGTVKTTAGGESCRFCHTPHSASPAAPLWNRDDPGTYYQTYESSTLVATVGQPTGASRLCLSCHDGTIALQQTYNPKNAPSGSIFISAQDRGFIGTDLSDDHPISFPYDAGLATQKGELRDPAVVTNDLPLDHLGQMQCTTCHDAHDDTFGQFLRMSNDASAMCRSCHDVEGWTSSPHATSAAQLAQATRDDWDNLKATTVASAACGSCHRPHTAGGRERLLRFEAEEDNCLSCHDGTVAQTDIAAAMKLTSAHDATAFTGVHDPTESAKTMQKHVECADCHDPHQSLATGSASAPQIKPSMAGASGLSSTGVALKEAQYEYQVCYKCHSTQNFADGAVVDRVLGDDNIATEFAVSNASYHPVEAQGQNGSVPSLLQDYQTTSAIYCTDCHGADDSVGTKGSHGSNYRPLLKHNYTYGDDQIESPQAYALCYQCHNRDSILADESFPTHRKHIVDAKTPCSVCHDPHGVKENSNLINFDRDIVKAASNSQGPVFTDLGTKSGSCTLSCHGKDHVGLTY